MANQVIIEGSGRHIHLKQETLEKLFGAGFQLQVKKMLSQPGQFASDSKVEVTGPKGSLKMSVLGLSCPVRESGDLAGTPGCTLTGPAGSVEIPEGCIIAKRHIHFTPEDAEKFGVKDKDIVQVAVEGDRALIFDEVVCRVNASYATFMHVDYDEINAGSIFGKDPVGTVIKK